MEKKSRKRSTKKESKERKSEKKTKKVSTKKESKKRGSRKESKRELQQLKNVLEGMTKDKLARLAKEVRLYGTLTEAKTHTKENLRRELFEHLSYHRARFLHVISSTVKKAEEKEAKKEAKLKEEKAIYEITKSIYPVGSRIPVEGWRSKSGDAIVESYSSFRPHLLRRAILNATVGDDHPVEELRGESIAFQLTPQALTYEKPFWTSFGSAYAMIPVPIKQAQLKEAGKVPVIAGLPPGIMGITREYLRPKYTRLK